MPPQTYFFTIFILTLALTRIGVYIAVHLARLKKQKFPEPYLIGLRIHHYMYGIILAIIGITLKNIPLYAIGLALFIDELPTLLLRGKSHEDNYSLKANLGVIMFAIIVFFAKDYMVFFTY